jgi:hypothetical protein
MSENLSTTPDQNISAPNAELFSYFQSLEALGVEATPEMISSVIKEQAEKQKSAEEQLTQFCNGCGHEHECDKSNEAHNNFMEGTGPTSPSTPQSQNETVRAEKFDEFEEYFEMYSGALSTEASSNHYKEKVTLLNFDGVFDIRFQNGSNLLGDWNDNFSGTVSRQEYRLAIRAAVETGKAYVDAHNDNGALVARETFTYDQASGEFSYEMHMYEEGEFPDPEEKTDEEPALPKKPAPDKEPTPNFPPIEDGEGNPSRSNIFETLHKAIELDGIMLADEDEEQTVSTEAPASTVIVEGLMVDEEVPVPVVEQEEYTYQDFEPDIAQLEIPLEIPKVTNEVKTRAADSERIFREPSSPEVIAEKASTPEESTVKPVEEDRAVKEVIAEPEIQAIESFDGTPVEEYTTPSVKVLETATAQASAATERYYADETGITLVDDEPFPEIPKPTAPELGPDMPIIKPITPIEPVKAIQDIDVETVPEVHIYEETAPEAIPYIEEIAEISIETDQLEEETPDAVEDNTWDILLRSIEKGAEPEVIFKARGGKGPESEASVEGRTEKLANVLEALSLFRSSQSSTDSTDAEDEPNSTTPNATAKVAERKAA